MKVLSDISKLFFLLISLIAIVAATRVSALERQESGKLFDAAKWLEQQKAISTKESLALRDLVAIQYDVNVGRPWQERLPGEIKKRWSAFREAFCPALKEMCLLSEDAELSSISLLLKQETTLKQINEHLKQSGSPLSIVRLKGVPGLLPSDISSLNDFNFLIAVISQEKSPDGQSYTRVSDTLLMDVGSYYIGFQKQPPSVYIAMDVKNKVLLFEETMIAKALEIAPVWQSTLSREIPEEYLYVPNKLLKSYALSKKDQSKKYGSLKSLQEVEWLAFDEIKALAVSQALFLKSSWDENLSDMDKELTIRRALLQLQKDFDQRLVSLLFLQQSYDQNAMVIQQYTPPSTVNTVMRENLNALLAASGFQALSYKKNWFASADFRHIQGEEYLKEFNYDLFEALDQINAFKKDWSALPTHQKRSIAIALVYPKNLGYMDEIKDLDSLIRTSVVSTELINKPGLYRLFATLAISKDLSLMSRLADEIYDKRFSSL